MALYRLMTRDRHGLKVGSHSMGPLVGGTFSRVVKPGEIIESEQPLDQLFRNKFEKIADPTPEPEPQAEPVKIKKTRRKVKS